MNSSHHSKQCSFIAMEVPSRILCMTKIMKVEILSSYSHSGLYARATIFFLNLHYISLKMIGVKLMVGLNGAKKPYNFNLICKCSRLCRLNKLSLFTKRVTIFNETWSLNSDIIIEDDQVMSLVLYLCQFIMNFLFLGRYKIFNK